VLSFTRDLGKKGKKESIQIHQRYYKSESMYLLTVAWQPPLHVHRLALPLSSLNVFIFRYALCLGMKQNVSITSCEMENEGLEVTAESSAHCVYREEQWQAHVLPYKPLTTNQCRELFCGYLCLVEWGRGWA
jgi:hypothetical protein